MKSITDFGALRRRRGGHRRPGARLRPALDEEGQAPVRALQEGRRRRGGRARHRRRQRAHLARRQAAHRGSVVAGARSAIRSAARVRGKVTSVTDFGVFVEIEEGVEGLDPRLAALHRAGRQAASLFKVGRRDRGGGHPGRRAREARSRSRIKALRRSEEREEVDAYLQREREGGQVLLRRHPDRGPRSSRQEQGLDARRRAAETRSRPSGETDRHDQARSHRRGGEALPALLPPRRRGDGQRGLREPDRGAACAASASRSAASAASSSSSARRARAATRRPARSCRCTPSASRSSRSARSCALRVDGKPWTPDDAQAARLAQVGRAMEVLWAPWRMAYIGAETTGRRLHLLPRAGRAIRASALLLGASAGQRGDAEPLSRTPARTCMVAPRRHTASLSDLPPDEHADLSRDAAAHAAHARRGAARRRVEPRDEPRRGARRRRRRITCTGTSCRAGPATPTSCRCSPRCASCRSTCAPRTTVSVRRSTG